jgi:hypothetical protein
MVLECACYYVHVQGHYHELGHNHQEASWTWECVGEVTCNFFSAYGMSVVRGFKDPSNFYGWFWDAPNQRREDREKYFADGPNHKVLCDSPSLYLDSFLQVRYTQSSCMSSVL